MITDPARDSGAFGTQYIGGTGLRVSTLCLGTMTFGVQMRAKEAHQMLSWAFDQGIYFFDTANAYSAGESERILGDWIQHRRDKVVVASKLRYQVGDDIMSVGLSRRTVKTEVENSLRRLKTDFLDILYLHQPDDQTSIGETLRAAEDLIREGKIHVLGVSNFAAWQIVQALWQADRQSVSPISIVQPMYNLIARGIEPELLPCCRSYGLSVYTYNPLAAGLLSGRYSPGKSIPKAGRFQVFPYYQDRFWNEAAFAAVEKLTAIAKEAGRSLLGLSFQWLLDHPDVTGIILGASSLQQLQQNIQAIGDPLPENVRAACDHVWQMLRGKTPQYNR